MTPSDIERMVVLNTLSYAKLAQLYGQDMKKKRRGRILMVSSMAGLCSASPNTAVYGATKAFGKSLALGMAKEMEPYGVGVTCLLPGAVRDTQFRDRSGTKRALCWSLPFYPRPADVVAHQGVVALLDGDAQVIPGWPNRVFVNIIRPIIPQRFEIMCIEAAFSPFQLPSLKGLLRRQNSSVAARSAFTAGHDEPKQESTPWAPLKTQSRFDIQPLPRVLTLFKRDDEARPKAESRPEPESEEIQQPPREKAATELSSSSTQSMISVESESGPTSVEGPRKDSLTEDVPDSTSDSIPFCQTSRSGTVGSYKTTEEGGMQPNSTQSSSRETEVDQVQRKERASRPQEEGKFEDVGRTVEEYTKQQQKVKGTDEGAPKNNSQDSVASNTVPNGADGRVEKGMQRSTGPSKPTPLIDDEEDTLSPFLRPIDIMEHRKYALPNQQSMGNKQPWTTIV